MKPPAIGEQFTMALQGTKIIIASVDEIKEVLRLVMIKIGLRAANWPTDEEKLVLIEHVVRHYAGHTCEEVKLAFDLAIAGKLWDLNTKGDQVTVEANCYENFSCLYFSNIMNAYRLWAKDEYKELPVSNSKQLPGPEEPPIPDEDFINTARNLYKMTKNFGLISTKVYGILVKQGKINLTDAEKEIIKQKARVNFFSADNQANKAGNVRLSFNEQERFIIQDAKKIAVAEYFNNNL